MDSKTSFARQMASAKLSHLERALGLLWFYREMQEFDERSASELANDLFSLGFPRPNTTHLKEKLNRSRYAVSGARSGAKRINNRYLDDLDQKYTPMLGLPQPVVTDSVLPNAQVRGTRQYLERMVHQINGSFDQGFCDCAAVMMRRLMESLIIECYAATGRASEIKVDGKFLMLDGLIKFISSDTLIVLSRSSPKTMREVKQLGDTAAHDRFYRTVPDDITPIRASYRRLITELLCLSQITT